MPDLLVLLTTLGGSALFGFPGLVIGPLIKAPRRRGLEALGTGAVDEAKAEAAATPTQANGGTSTEAKEPHTREPSLKPREEIPCKPSSPRSARSSTH